MKWFYCYTPNQPSHKLDRWWALLSAYLIYYMDIIVVKNQSYKKHDWIAKPKSDTFSILQRAKKDLRQGYSLHSNVKCNYKKYWVYQRSMTILTPWLRFQTLIRIFLHPPLQWKLLRHQDSLPLLDITNPVLPSYFVQKNKWKSNIASATKLIYKQKSYS